MFNAQSLLTGLRILFSEMELPQVGKTLTSFVKVNGAVPDLKRKQNISTIFLTIKSVSFSWSLCAMELKNLQLLSQVRIFNILLNEPKS